MRLFERLPHLRLMVVKSHGHYCQANLRAAPKLTETVLRSGHCKQNVFAALALFDPSFIAAMQPRKSSFTWNSLHRICTCGGHYLIQKIQFNSS